MQVRTPVFLILAFLLLYASVAIGQVRTAGVSVGNSFKHAVAFSWSSTDPNATLPSYYQDWEETEWVSTSIIDVSGTNVAGQITMHLRNGAELVQVGSIDIETGDGNWVNWVIAANLNPNDIVYSKSPSLRINETVTRDYPGGSRSTNHVGLTTEHNMTGPYLYQHTLADIYWDKQTGIMVEETIEEISQTSTSWETMSIAIAITESNVWAVSEFPTLTPIPVGVDVTVYPTSDLRLTFSNVTAEGYATAKKTSTVEAPLLPDLVGQYYDVNVTARYSGNVAVSLTYDDMNMTSDRESNLQMMQYTPIAGDIVNYGQVNILDISFVAKCFGTTPASSSWNATADINRDGSINILDISTCAKNFGKTAEWTNITTYVDTELNIVRGETTHFSMFGVT